FGLIIAPFAVPIAWAMCFVTVTGGFYRRLAARTGKPRLSAFLMTLGVAVAVVAPLAVVVTSLAREAASLSSTVVTVDSRARPLPGTLPPGAVAAPRAEAGYGDAWDRFFDKNARLRGWRDSVDSWLGTFG